MKVKAFVITLTDLEESMQVAQRCIWSAKKYGAEVKVFDAVRAIDAQAARESAGIPIDGFRGKYSRLNNVVACFMSHYALWNQCAESNKNIFILEHDAVFVNSIPTVDFKGLLSLGKPSYGNYRNPSMIGVNELTSKFYLPGAHAYMLKPYAARALIEKAKKEACPADVFLHKDRFSFLEEYYPWPVEAKDSFSTVQNETGIQAKHQYQNAPDLYKLL